MCAHAIDRHDSCVESYARVQPILRTFDVENSATIADETHGGVPGANVLRGFPLGFLHVRQPCSRWSASVRMSPDEVVDDLRPEYPHPGYHRIAQFPFWVPTMYQFPYWELYLMSSSRVKGETQRRQWIGTTGGIRLCACASVITSVAG